MSVTVTHIAKRFEKFPALRDVSLEVATGELVALLGPSGSGKTTLLRVIAGLEIPDAGRVFFQGEDDRVVPPNQAETLVEALRRKGTPVGYLLFSNEQHGFRNGDNIKRSLDAELYFYAVNVFRIGLVF